MKKNNQKVCQFFDQIVTKKISKIKHEYLEFQENFKHTLMKQNVTQALPPFSLLEFAGIQSKNVLKILYKGKRLDEYPCKYKELKDITVYLKKQIENKITKDFLKIKLLEKKSCELKYLNEVGIKLINGYINYYVNDDDFYGNLIHNLYLDRLSQINTSKFSLKEKEKFNRELFYPFIMRNICDKRRTVGSFRAIKKMEDGICREFKKQNKKDIDLNRNKKRVIKILKDLRLKSDSDLVDCEMIHLAVFGYDDHYCHCYTTDKKDIIKKRLDVYCTDIYFMERWFYEYLPTKRPDWKEYCRNYFPKQRPDWKCGKIFILNKDTGEKITKISVRKTYEKIKEYIDSELCL